MIEYIRGRVAALTPAAATLETTGGVAYLLHITLPTYSRLEGQANAVLYVHESIRDDAWVLYGFADERERELFRQLIGVSGVGAATAVIILSALPGDELAAVITGGDVKRLKTIKGIGAKTAERILVDLHDKVKVADESTLLNLAARSENYDEAMAALVMLGYDKKTTAKVLDKLYGAEPDLKVETAIRKALSMM